MLDAADIDTVTGLYGEGVSSYLSESDVIEKKTQTGAIVISKYKDFQECQRHYKNHLDERSRLKETKKKPNATKKSLGKCCVMPADLRRIVNDDTGLHYSKEAVRIKDSIRFDRESWRVPIFAVDNVSFEESFKNHIPWLTVPRKENCTVRMDWNYNEMVRLMTSSAINFGDTTIYNWCLPVIKPILMKFHRNHENFDYFASLKLILAEKSGGQKSASQFVSRHQFQKYCSRIFAKVIPLSLFGNHRNAKKARGVLKAYYLAPFGKEIPLKPFVERMKISFVTWLQPIENEAKRWSVFAKVIKWIFEYYFSVVLKTVFRIRESFYGNEKQFMLWENWLADKRNYIRDMERGKAVMVSVADPNTPEWMLHDKLALIPKQRGIRPIYMSSVKKKGSSADRDQLDLIKTLLKQLYYERYGHTTINDLHSILKSCGNSNEEENHHRWQVIACDIEEAYGSIIHAKLFDIVRAMINEVPHNMLIAKRYAVLARHRNGTVPKVVDAWFFTCCSDVVFRRGTLVGPVGNQDRLEELQKDAALTFIKNFIFNQTFQLGDKMYSLKQGVLQGSPLSPIFADIYYASMRDQEFRTFVQSDTLFRFVDDFLFISNDKHRATKFLQLINNPIEEYNCRFNKSKIQSNVRSSLCKELKSIRYLGYRINGTTLDVRPEYKRIVYHYSVKGSPEFRELVKFFSTQLNNTRSLKLHRLVLDPNVNSADTIVTTAGLSANMMASRCSILIPAIFKEANHMNRPVIMEKIRSAVVVLASIFKRRKQECCHEQDSCGNLESVLPSFHQVHQTTKALLQKYQMHDRSVGDALDNLHIRKVKILVF